MWHVIGNALVGNWTGMAHLGRCKKEATLVDDTLQPAANLSRCRLAAHQCQAPFGDGLQDTSIAFSMLRFR